MAEVNRPPVIGAFKSYPSKFVMGYGSGTATLKVEARDPEGDPLTYSYEIDGQKLTTDQPYGNLYPPQKPGKYQLKVTVTDGTNITSKEIEITVVDPKDLNQKLIGRGVIGLSFHKIYTNDEISKLPPDQRPDYLKNEPRERIYYNPNVYYYSFEDFKELITSLVADGYQIMPLRILVEAIYEQSDVKIPEKALFISFDDGDKSQYQALEYLAQKGYPSTLFTIGAKLLEKEENQYLTTRQLLQLTSYKDSEGKSLVEIASHSTTHTFPSLGFEPRGTHRQEERKIYQERIGYELNAGKGILERLLGVSIMGIAAPFGEGFRKEQVADPTMFPLLKSALVSSGYKYNRTTRWEYINYPKLVDPYMLSNLMPICIDSVEGMRGSIKYGVPRADGEYSKEEKPKMPAQDTTMICGPAPANITPTGQVNPLPALTLEEATGLIALSELFFPWANIGKCAINIYDFLWGGKLRCIFDINKGIDELQARRFRSYHIFGSHSAAEMSKIQTALLDPVRPPLVVSLDQELGIVNRFGWLETFKYIRPKVMVDSRKIENAENAGVITGKLLQLYGVNLNFAPFVDLHTYEPARRFSDDPKIIADYAGAFARGLQKGGIGACAKHFPDGGDVNPHEGISRIARPRAELFVKERYQPLINDGIAGIMVGHDIFTAVDPNNPASLSKIWITDILRKEMGFEGLVVTDALGMGAIKAMDLPYEEVIIRAFQAGVDLTLADPDAVRFALTRAYRAGRISGQRICESAQRIQAFAHRFPIRPPGAPEERKKIEADLLQRANSLYEKAQREAFQTPK